MFDLIKPASALPSVSFSINFEKFPDNSIVPSNTLISNQYQPVGVTFTSGNGPPLAVADSVHAASPPNILRWQGSGIITVNIVDPATGNPAVTNSISVTVIGLQNSNVVVTSYDATGTQLATASTVAQIRNTPLIFTNSNGIQKLVFTGSGAFGIDDLVGSVTPPPSVGPPTAPQFLVVNAVSSTEIDLSWQQPLSNGGMPITSYIIQRSDDGGKAFNTIITVGSTVTNYPNTGLQPNTTYIYQVIATNSVGSSPASIPASASTNSLIPDPPVNLVANAVSSTEIDLSWQPPANNGGTPINGYTIYRSTNAAGPFIAFINIGTSTTFADTGLNPNTTYYYQVVAHNNADASRPSNTASSTTKGLPPGAPNLSASTTSSTQINLSWQAPTNIGTSSITGYNIYQSSDGILFTKIGNTGSTTTSLQVTGLSPNTTYYFQVKAVNSVGEGTPSNTASAITFGIPSSPINLSASGVSTTEIDLNWQPPTNNGGLQITGYNIYQSSDGILFTKIGNTGSTTTSLQVTGLSPNTTYYFQVKAVNSVGEGTPSNTASATTNVIILPGAPNSISAITISATEIDLGWQPPLNDGGSPITDYEIFRDDGHGGPIVLLTNIGTPATSYHNTGLTPNTTYQYRVTAINGLGVGATTNIVTATTSSVVASPPTVTATAISSTQIDLGITQGANSGSLVTGYQIFEDSGSGFTSIIADTGSISSPVHITGLLPNHFYSFKAQSINGAGHSADSNTATATTLAPPTDDHNDEKDKNKNNHDDEKDNNVATATTVAPPTDDHNDEKDKNKNNHDDEKDKNKNDHNDEKDKNKNDHNDGKDKNK